MASTNNHTAPLLHHLAFVLGRQSDQVLQERLGIGMSQYRILTMVEGNPLLQQRDIAASLGQTEASVSRQLKLMKRKGLAVVQINPTNRRQHLTTLTLKGRQLTKAAQEVFEGLHDEALQALSAKQKAGLDEVLNALHQQACQLGKTAACDPLLQVWQQQKSTSLR